MVVARPLAERAQAVRWLRRWPDGQPVERAADLGVLRAVQEDVPAGKTAASFLRVRVLPCERFHDTLQEALCEPQHACLLSSGC